MIEFYQIRNVNANCMHPMEPLCCSDISLGGLLLQLVVDHGGLNASLSTCRVLECVNRLWFVTLVDTITSFSIAAPNDKLWYADFNQRNPIEGRQA